MIEQEDVERHQEGKGLTLSHPILLEKNDDITINDIKRIVEKAPTFQDSSKNSKQIREELQEVDDIIQEFMKEKNLRRNEEGNKKMSQEVNNPEERNRMDEVLMAIMSNHKNKVNQMGSLMEEDIPQLSEGWKKSCKDIMNGAPEKLPPLWEVNHQIPIINKSKRYKYHASRCPDSLKNELSEKIKCYTCTEWWEPTQVEQAALMLCIRKKNNTLRTVIDGQQHNDNMIKDITPLLDQDIIHLDIARVKIHSKIDLLDVYKQICIIPEDVHKTVFVMIYKTRNMHSVRTHTRQR